MAVLIMRPKGAKRNPEMRFSGKTKQAATASALGYFRKHPNITDGFYDENGVFHPIRASRDYSGARAGEGRRKAKKSKRAKKNPARRAARPRRKRKLNFGQKMALIRKRNAAKRKRR